MTGFLKLIHHVCFTLLLVAGWCATGRLYCNVFTQAPSQEHMDCSQFFAIENLSESPLHTCFLSLEVSVLVQQACTFVRLLSLTP